MKVNDRVRYNEQNVALDDLKGTVARPPEGEYPQTASDVYVEWDDGERFWEDPASLVVIDK